MRNNSFVNNREFTEVLVILLMAIFLTYFQTYFILILPQPFSLVDLVAVSIIFLAIEYEISSILAAAIIAGVLCDALVVSHSGFYLFYFVFALFLSKLIKKFFVLKNLLSKFLSFLAVYFLKFILVFFMIIHQSIPVQSYVSIVYQQFLVSILSFFLIAKVLTLFLDVIFVRNSFRK